MSGSGRLILASSSSSVTASDGSPRFVFVGNPGDADDVAEVDVDGPGAILGDEQLDLPGAVDEVEEDELPHVPPSHDAPGQAPRLAALLPGLDLSASTERQQPAPGRETASAKP